MKTIKIILGIISTFIIVFFATGLIIKETNYTTQVSVNKQISDVFAAFNNLENKTIWIPEIKSYKIINQNTGITGSEYQMVIKNKDQNITISERIMAFIPNEKVTIFYNVNNMLKTNDYFFTEKNGVTNITLKASCRSGSYILACVFPYFKSTFKEQDQKYLTNFKAFIEQ